jgi:ABC-type glycerol-3-phosphate transport system permease component
VGVCVNFLLVIDSCLEFRIYIKCCFPYLTPYIILVFLFIVILNMYIRYFFRVY